VSAPPSKLDLPGFVLRAWSVEDAAALRAALASSDAHLRAWTPWVIDGRVPGLTLEDRLARHAADFAAGTEWVYGLFTPDGTEVLGGCGLYPRVGPNAVELGYWLAAGHTGRGLATRAAAELTRVAFLAPDIDRVEIRCDPRNGASARVPQRLGYRIRETAAADLQVWELARAEFIERTTNDSLRACEAALRAAQLTSDVVALERLVDDALVFTGPDGALYGKGDDLAAHRQGLIRITRLEPSEERVQRFGIIAVVSVRMEMAGTFRGTPFAGPFRYTRIWCERPDGWRVVAGHVSAVLSAP
jgi:RimJ/RimL family protein N-acetyltransferase